MATHLDTKKAINTLLLTLGFAISVYIAFNSNVSNWLIERFKLNQRLVLSKITSDLFDSTTSFDIIKIKENNMIYLEVYKKLITGDSKLLSKISLNSENEGYFLFHNASTNLALNRVPGEPVPEIIVPTFDNFMTAHLNVVKYDKENQSFYLMPGSQYQNN